MDTQEFEVLLYYKYVKISNPDAVRDEQRDLCRKLGLKGRIIIANEGINGTVEGTIENTQKYIDSMEKSPTFKDISYKRSIGTGAAFPKLSVKSRPEIVTAGIPSLDPLKVTGKYLTSDELHAWFESKKEFYIVDMRNDFEFASGYFENSLPSGMEHFFNLPDVLPRIVQLREKTVVTVCTGGIRCEKASSFLVENGFSDVYQLKDGIQTYMEKYPNKYFKGKLYVFDKRLTIGFNTDSPDHKIVGSCMHCSVSTDTYVNCEYNLCHYHYISCNSCKDAETGYAFCKSTCKEAYLRSSQNKSSFSA